jgi:hypothetical protein
MHDRVLDVGVKRLARGDAPLHELDRPPGDLRVDHPALVQIVHPKRAALLALAPFHDVLELCAGRFRCRVRGPQRLVGRARNAIPLVEALVVRQAPVVPPDRHFPLRQTFESPADRDGVGARANRKAPGHDRRSARRALRLDIEIGEARTF